MVFAVLAAALGTVVLYAQLRELNQVSTLQIPAGGLRPALHYLETDQVARHRAVLEGRAGDPWQYRVFATWLNEGLFRAAQRLGDVSLPETFVAVRLVQNWLILFVYSSFLVALGLGTSAAGLGLSLLAYAMSLSTWHAGLAFATWYELAFFVAGALLVLRRRYAWLLPLALLAAANKESSLLLPVLLLGAGPPTRERGRLLAACFAGQLAVIALIRIGIGPQPLISAEGHTPGLDLLGYNVGRAVSWAQLLLCFGVVPLVAVSAWREWPAVLRRWCGWLVLPWLGAHFVLAIVAETRLLLVPHALVFLPAALIAVAGPPADRRCPEGPSSERLHCAPDSPNVPPGGGGAA